MYHYKNCGLDNIWLANGFDIETHETYGECISIHNLEGLHRSITSNIISTHPRLSGKEFRFLRKEIGFSQKTLGGLLGVEDQTIANWEKGKIEVPVMADRLIRLLCMERLSGNANLEALITTLSELEQHDVSKEVFMESEYGWKQAA